MFERGVRGHYSLNIFQSFHTFIFQLRQKGSFLHCEFEREGERERERDIDSSDPFIITTGLKSPVRNSSLLRVEASLQVQYLSWAKKKYE